MSGPGTLFGLPGETAVELIAAGANFAVMALLYRAFLPNDAVNARARALARRRKELLAGMVSRPRRTRQPLHLSANIFKRLVLQLQLNRGADGRKAADLLARAGWRNADALTVFQGIRLGAPVVLGVLLFLGARAVAPGHSDAIGGLGGLVGVLGGALGPSLLVQNAAQERRQKIEKTLPDALDLFVICAEAGLSLDAAMTRVAREIGAGAPELADELGLTAIELGFLPNRRDALTNFAKRVDATSIRGLVTTLAQTERYGTPLAHALRVLSGEFRNARMMRAEEKAARLPATLTVPMILFILPPLFVILIGPAIIQVLANLHN